MHLFYNILTEQGTLRPKCLIFNNIINLKNNNTHTCHDEPIFVIIKYEKLHNIVHHNTHMYIGGCKMFNTSIVRNIMKNFKHKLLFYSSKYL